MQQTTLAAAEAPSADQAPAAPANFADVLAGAAALPNAQLAGLIASCSTILASRAASWPSALDPLLVGTLAFARGDSFAVLESRCVRALRSHVIALPDSDFDAQLRLRVLDEATADPGRVAEESAA